MIDYGLIDSSLKYYEEKGFLRIETPWTVSSGVDDITRPRDREKFQLKHNDKCLVASAEQSFLYLYLKGFLPLGQFQSVTPCFRQESFDFLHTKYFVKNELIKTDVVNFEEMRKLAETALRFFQRYIPRAEIVELNDGFDIEVEGKELGSYGIRECEFLRWIYGTGCAEPRTSSLIKLMR